jgi:hypothetical protein
VKIEKGGWFEAENLAKREEVWKGKTRHSIELGNIWKEQTTPPYLGLPI